MAPDEGHQTAEPGRPAASLAVTVSNNKPRLCWLPLALATSTAILLLALGYGPGVLQRPACAGLQLPHALPAADAVLSSRYGGVHRYSIPGDLPKAPPANDTDAPRSGVLHVYLKALKWPVGNGSTYHLRLRGFVGFEPTAPPAHWPSPPYTFNNPPEVASRLRLSLAAGPRAGDTWRWRRRLALGLSTGVCEGMRGASDADFAACVAREAAAPRGKYNLAQLDANLGHVADTDVSLLVEGWPRRADLSAQLAAALAGPLAEVPPWAGQRAAAPPAGAGGSSGGGGGGTRQPPTVYRALPYMTTVPPEVVAGILRWSDAYHTPLGLAATILHVLPRDAAALSQQPAVRELVAAGRLLLVLWDQFQRYDGWRDYDLQVVESHPVLSMWGRNALVLVADLDEFIVTAVPGSTLPAMLSAGGCMAAARLRPECRVLERRALYAAEQGAAAPDEPAWWRNASGPSPLRRYRWSGVKTGGPKSLVDPGAVLPPSVHFTAVCAGGPSPPANDSSPDPLPSPCSRLQPCSWVPPVSCAWLGHVWNMFAVRRSMPAVGAQRGPIQPARWLWMLPPA